MKNVIAINVFIFALSIRGDEDCSETSRGFTVCKNVSTITRVTQNSDVEELALKLHNDTTIAPSAFSNLTIVDLELEFETAQELQRPYASLSLQPESFVGLTNLSCLSVVIANITFDGNPFLPLEGLTTLKFIYGEMKEVPTNLLNALPHLEILYIQNNHLSVIRANAFVTLTNLKFLHLGGNDISTLEPGCFNGLEELENLSLVANELKSVPAVFAGFSRLKYLDLSFNLNLSTIETTVLRQIPNIIELELDYCKLETIRVGMFDNNLELEILDLDGNDIGCIPKDTFSKLKKLRSLDLSFNNISKIETNAFSGLNLTTLHLTTFLRGGPPKILKAGIFNGLTVKHLKLAYNNISEIEPLAFNGVNADRITLSGNIITKINLQDFSGLTTERLILSDNQIEEIVPNAFKTTKVEKIHLGDNPIHNKDKTSWGLPESVILVYSEED